ncbi:MAG TPA: hypothetical protein VF587_00095 [Solirubrobacteraceae bacterium]
MRELNIITEEDARRRAQRGGAVGGADATTPDDALTKLLKYIPAVATGTYLALQGFVLQLDDKDQKAIALAIITVVIAAGTYVWRQRRGVKRGIQRWLTVIAFLVWVFALGGPFAQIGDWWDEWMGSVALILAGFGLSVFNLPPIEDDS